MNPPQARDALARAAEHIFSLGVDDAASALCLANMAYGLAKIHHLQRRWGLAPNATFIGSPDMTITRNTNRWAAGIGYGGKLAWGDAQSPFIVLDVKPNACGMLAGGLEQRPDIEQVARRVHELEAERIKLDGIPLEWDFGRGNHFIDVFEVESVVEGVELAPYVFVCHGAAPELRRGSAHGLGLYWDDSPALAAVAETVDTPWGPLHIVHGAAAELYWEAHQYAVEFSCRRRALAAELIFGDHTIISNTVHQRLLSRGEMLLGCYDIGPGPHAERRLFPFMLAAHLPGYLLEGIPNLTVEQMERAGFAQRARRLAVTGRLETANTLPHGAGYALPGLRGLKRVLEVGRRRYFVMETAASGQEQIISDLHDLAGAQYRGLEVLEATLKTGLGRVAATLRPQYVLKP